MADRTDADDAANLKAKALSRWENEGGAVSPSPASPSSLLPAKREPDAIAIRRTETAARGRYVGRIDGVAGVAELTYSRANPKLIIVDHTFAPESMRGKGAAKALVERVIADARAEGFKIFPLCTYVKAQAERHPEWADVIDASPRQDAADPATDQKPRRQNGGR